MIRGTFAALAAIALVSAAAPASAQCTPEWLPTEGIPGVTGDFPVYAAVSWDPDDAGPKPPVLVVGGGFIGAGSIATFGIAMWDGTEWTSPGGGMNGQVLALTVHNGDLIAAGQFTEAGGVPAPYIARWDGTSWHAMASGISGSGLRISELAVYNGELVAAGWFTHINGVLVNGVARWDGAAWHPLGGGVGQTTNGLTVVTALTVHDGDLVVAGGFSTVNGNAVPADNVARWNGSTWTGVNDPYDVSTVDALGVYNGELVAGGVFIQPQTNVLDFVMRWNGSGWQELGTGTNDHVIAFGTFDGDLIAGGWFTNAGGVTATRIARWDGANWSSMGFGMRGVEALATHNDRLIIGGTGSRDSGLQMSLVIGFDGEGPFVLGQGMDGVILDFETYNGDLVAGGSFAAFDSEGIVFDIARRTPTGWEPIGPAQGVDGYISKLAVYNGDLIAAGPFNFISGLLVPGVARWDGAAWHPFGTTSPSEMLVHNGVLYGAGSFGPDMRVARWDDELQDWAPLGVFPPNTGITAMTIHNGDLVAGGIGGLGNTASVWRWDFDAPGTWTPIGQHLGSTLIRDLAVYNGDLFACGNIAGTIMRFDGTSWVIFGGGLYLGNDTPADTLIAFEMLVRGTDLYIAGSFTHAGDQQYSPGAVSAYHIVRWDGTAWNGLGVGLSDASVTAHFHDGDLFVGGWFDIAGGAPAGHWARWGCEDTTCPADWDGNDSVNSADISAFLTSWLASVQGGTLTADFNTDGAVNSSDISAFLTAWLAAVQGGC